MDIIEGIGTTGDNRGIYLCDHHTTIGKRLSLTTPVLDCLDGIFITTEWVGFLAYHLNTDGLHIVERFLPYYINGSPQLN